MLKDMKKGFELKLNQKAITTITKNVQKESANEMAEKAKALLPSYVPTDSGNLLNAHTIEVVEGKNGVDVNVSVSREKAPYASFVHILPQSSLTNGYSQWLSKIHAEMVKGVKK